MHLPAVPDLPLRTERLTLRAFRPDDLEALLVFHGDPEAVRYVPYEPRDRAALEPVVARKVGSTALGGDGDLLELAAEETATGRLVGDLLLVLRSVRDETLEVGYIFDPASGGRGLATEAVRALLDLAFHAFGTRRVVARVDDRNTASCRLLERLGLRQEARLVENEWFKGVLSSEVDYAVLAREWPAAGPAA